MAGSIKQFIYTTSLGDDFAIKLDESNTEVVNAGAQDFPNTGSAVVYELPKNVTPRYIRFTSDDNTITRKCVALTETIFAGVAAGSTLAVGAVTLTMREKIGERIIYPKGVDTGQTDGDAT